MSAPLHDPSTPPPPELFEEVPCVLCGSRRHQPEVTAQEDLTGKPGDFHFVRCEDCGLVYQNPRLPIEQIGAYYDDEYIAHRKTRPPRPLRPFFEWLMGKLDRDKEAIVARAVALGPHTRVLDVGCGAGGFLGRLRRRHGVSAVGVDFKDLSEKVAEHAGPEVVFHHGTLDRAPLAPGSFDLITMWHFLEHDYDPIGSLARARALLAPGGRLVVEVPRLDSLTRRLYGARWPGWQAPQHTIALDQERLLRMVEAGGLVVEEYLAYGAYPGYFYVYAGAAFTLRRGRGIDPARALGSYLLGQLLLSPVMLFERWLNLSMQIVVCRRPDDP